MIPPISGTKHHIQLRNLCLWNELQTMNCHFTAVKVTFVIWSSLMHAPDVECANIYISTFYKPD